MHAKLAVLALAIMGVLQGCMVTAAATIPAAVCDANTYIVRQSKYSDNVIAKINCALVYSLDLTQSQVAKAGFPDTIVPKLIGEGHGTVLTAIPSGDGIRFAPDPATANGVRGASLFSASGLEGPYLLSKSFHVGFKREGTDEDRLVNVLLESSDPLNHPIATTVLKFLFQVTGGHTEYYTKSVLASFSDLDKILLLPPRDLPLTIAQVNMTYDPESYGVTEKVVPVSVGEAVEGIIPPSTNSNFAWHLSDRQHGLGAKTDEIRNVAKDSQDSDIYLSGQAAPVIAVFDYNKEAAETAAGLGLSGPRTSYLNSAYVHGSVGSENIASWPQVVESKSTVADILRAVTPDPTPTITDPPPTLTPTATPTSTPTHTPTTTPTGTVTPSPTGTATPTTTPTGTVTPSPTNTVTVNPTSTVTVNPTSTVTVNPTSTVTVNPTSTVTVAPTSTPSTPTACVFDTDCGAGGTCTSGSCVNGCVLCNLNADTTKQNLGSYQIVMNFTSDLLFGAEAYACTAVVDGAGNYNSYNYTGTCSCGGHAVAGPCNPTPTPTPSSTPTPTPTPSSTPTTPPSTPTATPTPTVTAPTVTPTAVASPTSTLVMATPTASM